MHFAESLFVGLYLIIQCFQMHMYNNKLGKCKSRNLSKGLESPLDYKEIQPVHPKGDQSWVFTGRTDTKAETPILWPPHAKS